MTSLAPTAARRQKDPDAAYPGWVKCTLMVGLPGMLWALVFAAAQAAVRHHL